MYIGYKVIFWWTKSCTFNRDILYSVRTVIIVVSSSLEVYRRPLGKLARCTAALSKTLIGLGANKLYNLLPHADENATSLFSSLSLLLLLLLVLVRFFFSAFSHHRSRFHSLCRIGCFATGRLDRMSHQEMERN